MKNQDCNFSQYALIMHPFCISMGVSACCHTYKTSMFGDIGHWGIQTAET